MSMNYIDGLLHILSENTRTAKRTQTNDGNGRNAKEAQYRKYGNVQKSKLLLVYCYYFFISFFFWVNGAHHCSKVNIVRYYIYTYCTVTE